MKVKFFEVSYLEAQNKKSYAQTVLEDKINDFIKDKVVESLSYTSAGGNHCAVILYEELEEYHDQDEDFEEETSV